MTYEEFRKQIGDKAYSEGHYSIVDVLPRTVFTDKIQTMATNSTNIFISPKFLDSISSDEVIGVLFHELFHDIYGHTSPSWAVYDVSSGVSRSRWHELCNIAQDAIINDQVKKLGLSLPKGGIFKEDLGIPDTMSTAHEVFQKLLEDEKSNRNSDAISNAIKQLIQEQMDNQAVQNQPPQKPSKNGYPVGSPQAAKKKKKVKSSSSDSGQSKDQQQEGSNSDTKESNSDSKSSSQSGSSTSDELKQNELAQKDLQKEQEELEQKKSEVEKKLREIESSGGSSSKGDSSNRDSQKSDATQDNSTQEKDEKELQEEKKSLEDDLASNKKEQEQLKREEQELSHQQRAEEQGKDSASQDEDGADSGEEDEEDSEYEDDYYNEFDEEDSTDSDSANDSKDDAHLDENNDSEVKDDSAILDEVRQQLQDLYANEIAQKITQTKKAAPIYKPVLPKKQSWVDIVFQSAGKYLSTIDRTRTYQRRSHRPSWGLADQQLKTPFKGSRPGDFKPKAWFYVDVSGSMYSWNPVTKGYNNVPDEIRAELAKHAHILRDTQSVVIPFDDRLYEAMDVTKELPLDKFKGGTDLDKVIASINSNRNKYDIFVVVTDCSGRFDVTLIDPDKRIFIVTQFPESVVGAENRNVTVIGVDRF